MGNLPKPKVRTGSVDIDGEPLELRGLTRGEFLQVGKAAEAEPETADPTMFAFAASVSYDEAKAWLDEAPIEATISVMEKCLELSGLASPKDSNSKSESSEEKSTASTSS